MAIYLGFLRNIVTGDEFVAPVDADSRGRAEMLLIEKYPPVAYELCTTYARSEIDRILSNLDRWPGLPSQMQPSLDQLLSRVHVGRKGLPPLPGQYAQQQRQQYPSIDGARIEQLRGAAKAVSPQVQALAARLLAAGMGKPAAAPAAPLHSDQTPAPQAAPARPLPPRVPTATMVAQHMVQQQQQQQQRPSLLDVLKAMKR